MNAKQFTGISDYLAKSYEDAFFGVLYDLHGQGIPLIFPIDQEEATRAIQLNSKLSEGLYKRLGVDTQALKTEIRGSVSRGIASNESWGQVARSIQNRMNIGLNRAIRIARTEGHRIQNESRYDAQVKAKQRGANVVKQWDATLDRRTRPTHQQLDGQIREIEEPYVIPSNGRRGMYPGEFGVAAEDINCRCASLQRARWALDKAELQTLKDRAAYFGLDKAESFNEFKGKYLKATEGLKKQGDSVYNTVAASGAYNDSNDPDWKKRDAHADQYYASMRNGKKVNIVEAIAKNADVDSVLVSKMYDHLLVNKYNLGGEIKRFDASYDIAQSLQRLREGKSIQEHDLILIYHEATEYVLMNQDGLSYEEAHKMANRKYNYATALKKFLKQKDGE